MPRSIFSTLVIEGYKFEAYLGAGGPKLAIYEQGKVAGEIPLGRASITHDTRRGATLQDMQGNSPPVQLRKLTRSGANVVMERYGLSPASGTPAPFKESPAWDELRSWVAEHPILTKRMSGIDHDLPGWHAEITAEPKRPTLAFRAGDEPSPFFEPLKPVPGAVSNGDLQLVADEGQARILPAMAPDAWKKWLRSMEVHSNATSMKFIEELRIGTSDTRKSMAMDISAEEDEDLSIIVGVDMLLDAETRTMTVQYHDVCHEDVYPENATHMAIAGACRMILGNLVDLARQAGPGVFTINVSPERFTQAGFSGNFLELALSLEWARIVREDPSLGETDLVVGRADKMGVPVRRPDLRPVEVSQDTDGKIVAAMDIMRGLAERENMTFSLTPNAGGTDIEMRGARPSIKGFYERTSHDVVRHLTGAAVKADLLALLERGGMKPGATIVVGAHHVGLVPEDVWSTEAWGTDGVVTARIVHETGLTEGQRSLEMVSFVQSWDYNLENVVGYTLDAQQAEGLSPSEDGGNELAPRM